MFRHPLFRDNARKYNLIFQFTSTGAVVNQQLASREGGVKTYNVQGRIVHRMGTLLPLDEAYPRMFAQVYIFDGNMRYDLRTRHPELGLNDHFIKLLTDYINEHNEYAKAFVRAGQFMIENPGRHIHLKLHERGDTDPRTHNLPRLSEVAGLIVDDEYLEEGRDIIVRMKPTKDTVTGKIHALQRISELHECYDPMAWPIVYRRGEPGLNPIKSRMPKDNQKKNIDFGEESYAPCMKDGKCSKKYPRPFQETTTIDRNGVVFKRPNNQRTILKSCELAEVIPLRINSRTQKVLNVTSFSRVVEGANKSEGQKIKDREKAQKKSQ